MIKVLGKIITALLFVSLFATAHAEVKNKTIEYKDGDTVMKGYIAWDDSIKEKRPAVIVGH